MDALEINYRLRRLGKTQTQIARDLGVRSGVVSNVIHDRITAHAVALHIAGLLGLKVQDIWPDRYVFKPRGPSAKKCGARNDSIVGGDADMN
jgi:lambda repressor-like predicted transcriptional regulator